VLQLYSFDSGYSLVVLEEGGGGIREVKILQFFSQTVIWTSTLSIIRIEKLFVIDN
jgi:hypothetical protein